MKAFAKFDVFYDFMKDDPVLCPLCGFPSRPLCSMDGRRWRYICERCRAVFEPEDQD